MRQRILDYLLSLLNPEAYGLGTIAVEMIFIGIVVYSILRFLHGTRGARLLQGIAILLVVGFLVVTLVAEQLHLDRIVVLYRPLVWTIFLTALVVFQPELRRGLMRLGETRWRRDRLGGIEQVARPIATACAKLSKNKIGALLAIERDVGLSGLTDQGVRLDAKLTPELLDTIFYPGGALHDLGVIVQRGRIAAAGCPFPLGDAEGLDRSIGSRHRAAIGLSLDSDAIVVVVSEETGAISVAENGRLHRHVPPEALFGVLKRYLARSPGSIRGWIEEPEPPPAPLRPAATTETRLSAPPDDERSVEDGAADDRETASGPTDIRRDDRSTEAASA
ncbi:MAG TPA: diadenylate cyclase [Phycisphaerae bacterium]|nr:diadenylate cyclase [Phycisphaerae bacterium]